MIAWEDGGHLRHLCGDRRCRGSLRLSGIMGEEARKGDLGGHGGGITGKWGAVGLIHRGGRGRSWRTIGLVSRRHRWKTRLFFPLGL